MKRQVHPHVPSGRLGTPSGSGQAGVCAIAGRTGLGRGLVDGRNNRSDCPLDNLRSFLLALVFGTSRAAGKALQRLFDTQIVVRPPSRSVGNGLSSGLGRGHFSV
jgi:hypothetical protein